ncbi:hypothetical protein V6259_18875 [Marinomonas sp. TI.3.20]|uniref:hypothetical protein n=1 Tax=Marinomonas sp. TI.3.20 TaxID=3121296 RepID=UPI00311D805A
MSEIKLGTFLQQRCCESCGEVMNTTRTERNSVICAKDNNSRSLEDISQERIFFEHFRNRLVSLRAKGFMVHENNESDGEPSRGKFLRYISSSEFSHPSEALILAAPLLSKVRKIGKRHTNFFKVIECLTPESSKAWRLTTPKKIASYISILESTLNVYEKGFYHQNLIVEPVVSDEDSAYVTCCIMANSADIHKLSESEVQEYKKTASSYSKVMPAR